MRQLGLKNYSIYIIILTIIAITASLEPLSSQVLQFDRSLIEQGQVWRLFTANWVHASVNHSFLNALGIVLLAYFAGAELNNRLGFFLVIFATCFVGMGLYLWVEDLEYYVGLSGAEHGFLIVAPFASKYYSRRIAIFIALVVWGKIIWEQTPFYNDMAEFELIGARVETHAHLLGAVAGSIYLAVWLYIKHLSRSKK